ncbi:MAG: DUF1826 domain-containing protein [Pseudomonadota bacterium]
MTAVANPRVGSTPVAEVASPLDLTAIHHPGCAAAIWRRDLQPEFQSWMDALQPHQIPTSRTTLRPASAREAVLQICEISGTPECDERSRLIDDVTVMIELFADLMSTPFVSLRLEAVNSNACRKFHIDAVTARLICTYRGAGTQYGIAVDEQPPTTFASVPTGDPILLRGTRWPENPQSGLRHRSPPIEGTGATRFVMVLDVAGGLRRGATP